MRTDVREDRLIIVSDVHMGNILVRAGEPFRKFLRFALDHHYSVCINGDGVDIVQLSISRLTHELSGCFSIFRGFQNAGLRVYYTVGNHDIVLEHFLQDFGGILVVPFLNVQSGQTRLRVEHGHMYDRIFLKYPRFYAITTTMGRWAILLGPETYRFMHRWVARSFTWPYRLRSRLRGDGGAAHNGERPAFRASADEIAQRGFDAVVFGHTHKAAQARLPSGALYFNTGCWMLRPWCVLLDHGEMRFLPIDELAADGGGRLADRSANRPAV